MTSKPVQALGLKIEPTLLNAVIDGTLEGVSMTGIEPVPVGASRMLTVSRPLSVLVSLVGPVSGGLTVNISEHAAKFLAGQMLCEEQTEVNEETLDAICEVGNMVAGSIKTALCDTEFEFTDISCPSLIVGANYSLYHYRGFNTASVEFEISEISMAHLHDKFFTVAVSLMRLGK